LKDLIHITPERSPKFIPTTDNTEDVILSGFEHFTKSSWPRNAENQRMARSQIAPRPNVREADVIGWIN
jgi:hypothetical protein